MGACAAQWGAAKTLGISDCNAMQAHRHRPDLARPPLASPLLSSLLSYLPDMP